MTDQDQVQKIIEEAYLTHWMTIPNAEAMAKDIHDDANVYVILDGNVVTFNKQALKDYVNGLELPEEKVTWDFNRIEIINEMALVKLTVYRDGEPSVIDFFNLYKTNEGWKIVAKIFVNA